MGARILIVGEGSYKYGRGEYINIPYCVRLQFEISVWRDIYTYTYIEDIYIHTHRYLVKCAPYERRMPECKLPMILQIQVVTVGL